MTITNPSAGNVLSTWPTAQDPVSFTLWQSSDGGVTWTMAESNTGQNTPYGPSSPFDTLPCLSYMDVVGAGGERGQSPVILIV